MDDLGLTVFVQERFRDVWYRNYNDATLRFRREFNPNPGRIKSEFYKIKADYLVYGITNGKKFSNQRETLTDFIKWVVLDMKFIQRKFRTGELVIETSAKKTCWIENRVLKCPENFNPDRSSSFIPFDVKFIVQLWGNRPVVAQKGFL